MHFFAESEAESAIGKIFNLKALHEAPKNVFKNLNQDTEVQKIGRAIARYCALHVFC